MGCKKLKMFFIFTKMDWINYKKTIILFITIVLCSCGEHKYPKLQKMQAHQYEGYLHVIIQPFKSVDNTGTPINPIPNENNFFADPFPHTRYLYNNCMIYVLIRKSYTDGKYVKSDSIGYAFFDLDNSMYASFDTLSPNAKMLGKQPISELAGKNSKQTDPLFDVNIQEMIKITDTLISGRKYKIATYFSEKFTDSLTINYVKKIKFWINPQLKKFPLQFSQLLSDKFNNEFVYKMQIPLGDTTTQVMVYSYEFQPAKLPPNIIAVFKRWKKRLEAK